MASSASAGAPAMPKVYILLCDCSTEKHKTDPVVTLFQEFFFSLGVRSIVIAAIMSNEDTSATNMRFAVENHDIVFIVPANKVDTLNKTYNALADITNAPTTLDEELWSRIVERARNANGGAPVSWEDQNHGLYSRMRMYASTFENGTAIFPGRNSLRPILTVKDRIIIVPQELAALRQALAAYLPVLERKIPAQFRPKERAFVSTFRTCIIQEGIGAGRHLNCDNSNCPGCHYGLIATPSSRDSGVETQILACLNDPAYSESRNGSECHPVSIPNMLTLVEIWDKWKAGEIPSRIEGDGNIMENFVSDIDRFFDGYKGNPTMNFVNLHTMRLLAAVHPTLKYFRRPEAQPSQPGPGNA